MSENQVMEIGEDGRVCKSDLINLVSSRMEMSKRKSTDVVNLIFDTLSDSIVAGKIVTIKKFGSFFIRSAKSRTFKKIGTEEEITIGERNLPKMRFSKELTTKVRELPLQQ